MTEEDKKEEGSQEPSEEKKEDKKEEGEKDSPLSPNERAEKNIAAMKAENDRMDKNLLAQQEMRAEDMLGGTSNAGQIEPKKEKLSDIDYANAMEKGEVDPFKEDGF